MIDILSLLHDAELSLEKAENIFDETIDNIHEGGSSHDWWTSLGLSQYEATAYAHGASVEDLIKLRYEGWPKFCCRCQLPLDYRLFGWWFIHTDDGDPQLRHIQCPAIASKRRDE